MPFKIQVGDALPSSGLFIALYDKETLDLYLTRGVYGFLMRPELEGISPRSRHYAALADYACGRNGAHVFFFLKRRIVYGGQLVGSEDYGCFYLNGPFSPMGRAAEAGISWDESEREKYKATDKPGIFKVLIDGEYEERCQPYLIRFTDKIGLRGNSIQSDDLYFELGRFSYPLPSNSMQGMGFCTLTPGETDTLLSLLRSDSECVFRETSENVDFVGDPAYYNPRYGIQNLTSVVSESHLEASVLANSRLLPSLIRPRQAAICRQVPISPFKPYQMDRADICYYFTPTIAGGTIPNTVIELKRKTAGKSEVDQVVRYLKWLRKIAPASEEDISCFLFAPSFTRSIQDYIPKEFRDHVELLRFKDVKQRKLENAF